MEDWEPENDQEIVLEGVKFVSNSLREKTFEVPFMTSEQMRIYLETITYMISGMGTILKQKDDQLFEIIATAVENLSLR